MARLLRARVDVSRSAATACYTSGRPIQLEALLLCSTLTQIQVDQILVRDTRPLRQVLEVFDRRLVETNRYLPLALCQVGVGLGVGEVISLFHGRCSAY